MPRFFNTTGPCDPRRHYMLAPERRIPDLTPFIEREQYFVLHAARQTGKTTAMRALAATLRERGILGAWATLEASQGVEETAVAEPLWLQAIAYANQDLGPTEGPPDRAPFVAGDPGARLQEYLTAWAAKLDRPLVLLLDEVDVMRGPALISFLRQLRAGYMDRAVGRFPTSMGLIGMRDLRDYLTESKAGVPVNPGSPFNIKAASITLRNFNEGEVAELLAQHTEETGQPFEADAVARIHHLTEGQPFLVNWLADRCVTSLVPDRSVPVTAAHVDEAKDQLILARTTHLDALGQRLREPRVAKIVQALLLGDEPQAIPYESDDFDYVVDLGLIRRGPSGAEIANPLYREVLGRELSYRNQSALPPPWWPWARPDGRLDFPALVEAFRPWWRENADVLREYGGEYREASAHIALMAFLQRVINGGGQILREFSAGRGRLDLVVSYRGDRFAVEVKRIRERDGLERVRDQGIAQLAAYLESLGLTEGWLFLFDVRQGRSWDERLWTEDVEVDGKRLHLIGG